jgi:hypothetical protein
MGNCDLSIDITKSINVIHNSILLWKFYFMK